MTGQGRDDTAVRVLVVCTGNVCRSPAGEHLLRAALVDLAGHVPVGAGVDVASAGTMAPTGRALDRTPARCCLAAASTPPPTGPAG